MCSCSSASSPNFRRWGDQGSTESRPTVHGPNALPFFWDWRLSLNLVAADVSRRTCLLSRQRLAPTHVGGYGSGVQRAKFCFGEISPMRDSWKLPAKSDLKQIKPHNSQFAPAKL